MSFKKILVFIIVVFFHLVVLGVVYVSTREARETEDNIEAVSNSADIKNPTAPIKPNNPPATNNSTRRNPTQSTGNNSNSSGKYFTHTVGKGDYLGKIASKYKVPAKDIIRWNELKNKGNHISLGQKLKIYQKK